MWPRRRNGCWRAGDVFRLVRQAAQHVAARRGLSGRGIQAVEQPPRRTRTEGVAAGGDPARVILRTSAQSVDRVAQRLIVDGLGESEEIRSGRFEGGGQFPLGVLHAGCKARI